MRQKEPLINSERKLEKVGEADHLLGSFVDNQNYLINESCILFSKEWTSLFNPEEMRLDFSPEHPFSVMFDLKYPKFVDLSDDLNTARVFLGIKDPQKEYQESIEMGVYMGRIYIREIFDVVNIPKEKLIEGVKIVLQVSPNKMSKNCSTILTVLDQSGFEITLLKTNKFLSTDWKGGISPGAHFKSLRIVGVQS